MISDFLPEGLKVGAVYQLRLPTYVNVSAKTRKAVNLNIYRNLHHHHLHKQKQEFHNTVRPMLKWLPKAEMIWVHYQIFAPRHGRMDTMNVGSIVDKYFMDTLVEAGKIKDDDYTTVVLTSFSFGGVTPLDGHAIATIHFLEKEKPMRVLLDKDDIQKALEAYLDDLGLTGATGVSLNVINGEIEAEVIFGTEETTATPQKSRGGRPRGSKNRPKVEHDDEVSDADINSENGSAGPDLGGSEASEESVDSGKGSPAKKAADESEAEGTKGKNLFGDEEDQSSDTNADSRPQGEAVQDAKPVTKKSSIFDEDD